MEGFLVISLIISRSLVYKSLIVFGGNLVTESLTKSAEFVFAN